MVLSQLSQPIFWSCSEIEEGAPSRSCADDVLWRNLWKLKTPYPVRHIVWRAFHDILSTWFNPQKRKCLDLSTCPICCQEEETIIHVLWDCLAASDVWGEATSPLQKWSSSFTIFRELWVAIMHKFLPKDQTLCATIFHNIWFRRNDFLFNNRFDCPKQVLNSTSVQCSTYHEACCASTDKNSALPPVRRWTKPYENQLKFNWDAALGTASGFGGVCRDYCGEDGPNLINRIVVSLVCLKFMNIIVVTYMEPFIP